MKRAMVIGASQSLGAHLATRLVEQGWMVTGTGRRPFKDVEITQNIEYVQADLSDVDSLNLLSGRLKEVMPDLIVYNAAAYSDWSESIPTLGELEMVFRVNAFMPYRLLLEYLSTASQDRFCSCVMINSDSIYHAHPRSGVYAASKAALRVFTSVLAEVCHSRNASISTLLLGPLADPKKVGELHSIAQRRGLSDEEVIHMYLRKSNPSFVIDSLIDFESCIQSILYIASLGRIANGMLCKLDGGSSGSLV